VDSTRSWEIVTEHIKFKISGQLAYKGGKIVSPTHRPSLHPGNITGIHLLEAESTPGLLCDWKDSMNKKFQ
jgi:hypothetical protein